MTLQKETFLNLLDDAISEAQESCADTCCFRLFSRKPRAKKLVEFKQTIESCHYDDQILLEVQKRTGNQYDYRQGGSTKMIIQDALLLAYGNDDAKIKTLLDDKKFIRDIDARYDANVANIPNIRHSRALYQALMPRALFRQIEVKKHLYAQILNAKDNAFVNVKACVAPQSA